ncbi:hypothetical protein GCM10027605_71680 [Micromonospora zhanjiangensis]
MDVTLFALGGTISMTGHDGGGVVSRLGGADLVAAVPGLAGTGVSLDVRDPRAVPSANLTFGQVLDVLDDAAAAVAGGAHGVVVTQGTDTLEETAFLADLVWPHAQPLVFTGAMRNPTLPGADGPANLLAAVRVAADRTARDLGALVAFKNEIHAARWVAKSHSSSTATFVSPNLGPVGHVVEGRVRLLVGLPRHAPLPGPPLKGWPPTGSPCTPSRWTTTARGWPGSPTATRAWWSPASAWVTYRPISPRCSGSWPGGSRWC